MQTSSVVSFTSSIFPYPFCHLLTVGVIRRLRNSLNGTPVLIIIDHRLVVLRGIPGRLIILINRVADQRPKNGSCSQSDEGALCVASNRLADEGTCAGADHGPACVLYRS